jgi:hypothetical protein
VVEDSARRLGAPVAHAGARLDLHGGRIGLLVSGEQPQRLVRRVDELDRRQIAVALDEAALPLRPSVVGACEILGIDPLYVANEGKLVAVVAPEAAGDALERLRAHDLGAEAAVIGEIRSEPAGLVLLDTAFGGSRIVDMLVGDPLPRIC